MESVLAGPKVRKNLHPTRTSEVKVIEEAHFPVEFMANDPTAKAVMKKSNITTKSLSEIAYSVASVKVYGQKPIATR
jgi:hypothetical protein